MRRRRRSVRFVQLAPICPFGRSQTPYSGGLRHPWESTDFGGRESGEQSENVYENKGSMGRGLAQRLLLNVCDAPEAQVGEVCPACSDLSLREIADPIQRGSAPSMGINGFGGRESGEQSENVYENKGSMGRGLAQTLLLNVCDAPEAQVGVVCPACSDLSLREIADPTSRGSAPTHMWS